MNEPEAMKLRANEPLQSGNTSEPGAPALRQTLGSPSIVFMVLAAAAPLTAAAGVLPLSFLFSDNFAAPVYFVVATVLMLLFAVGYTALSRMPVMTFVSLFRGRSSPVALPVGTVWIACG